MSRKFIVESIDCGDTEAITEHIAQEYRRGWEPVSVIPDMTKDYEGCWIVCWRKIT